ncbi:MAG: hypothetical protein V8Q43_02615 [Christensenellaceae bacterium]
MQGVEVQPAAHGDHAGGKSFDRRCAGDFGVYTFAYKHYIAPVDPNSTEEITVVIGENDSLKAISKKLQEAGVIRNSTIFKYYVDFSDMSTKLLAGKFTLSPSMS